MALLCSAFLATAGSAAPTEASKPDSEQIVTVCKIQYTDLARKSSFHLLYAFRVVTSADGTVSEVSELPSKKWAAVVRDHLFVPCLRTWKLGPNSEYAVEIGISWNPDENYIGISHPDGSKLRLRLGEWGWQGDPRAAR
jgi:hypothetical protein